LTQGETYSLTFLIPLLSALSEIKPYYHRIQNTNLIFSICQYSADMIDLLRLSLNPNSLKIE